MTVPSTATVEARTEALADDIAARGLMRDRRWRTALHQVPRYIFVPRTARACPDFEGARSRAIDREAREADWWDAVYSDTSIVTQADDGASDPASGTGMVSSSNSAPGMVMAFLELLDVRDHDRVLEIGTGTGWTAALLSWRVGADAVTSIEVDEAIAVQAEASLRAAGYAPHLVVGDGADGWTEGSPYDRVHVTCAVERVPHAWIEQVRPGGVIVLPWSCGLPRGRRMRLTVRGDGTAIGRFAGPATFTMLRSQRREMVWNAHHADQAERGLTRLDPRTVAYVSTGADLV